MLVLTRKLQEQIRIGNNVTITVLRVKGQAVRIGIEAPRDVRVVRAELPRDGESDAASAPAPADASDTRQNDGPACHEKRESSPSNAEDQPPADLSSRRLPQRRMINRYGAPPLRLACSQVLASAVQ